MSEVDKITEARGERYGDFRGHATASQLLKGIIRDALADNEQYQKLSAGDQHVLNEGLEMIAHKIGRIVNGDPTYDDNFLDIEGYSKITRERVCKTKGA